MSLQLSTPILYRISPIVSSTSLTLNWSTVKNINGTNMTYILTSPEDANDPYTTTQTSYTIPNLTQGASYTYSVTARNTGDADSLPSTFIPFQPCLTPNAPINLIVSTINTRSSIISWTLASGNGPGDIRGYAINGLPRNFNSNYLGSGCNLGVSLEASKSTTMITYIQQPSSVSVQAVTDAGYSPLAYAPFIPNDYILRVDPYTYTGANSTITDITSTYVYSSIGSGSDIVAQNLFLGFGGGKCLQGPAFGNLSSYTISAWTKLRGFADPSTGTSIVDDANSTFYLNIPIVGNSTYPFINYPSSAGISVGRAGINGVNGRDGSNGSGTAGGVGGTAGAAAGGGGGGGFGGGMGGAFAGCNGGAGGSFTIGGTIFPGTFSTPYINVKNTGFGVANTFFGAGGSSRFQSSTIGCNGAVVFSFFSTNLTTVLGSNTVDQGYSTATGILSPITVPQNTNFITVNAWGGGGGSVFLSTNYFNSGGAGACVTQSFPYTSGTPLYYFIGGGGEGYTFLGSIIGTTAAGGVGGGGAGGSNGKGGNGGSNGTGAGGIGVLGGGGGNNNNGNADTAANGYIGGGGGCYQGVGAGFSTLGVNGGYGSGSNAAGGANWSNNGANSPASVVDSRNGGGGGAAAGNGGNSGSSVGSVSAAGGGGGGIGAPGGNGGSGTSLGAGGGGGGGGPGAGGGGGASYVVLGGNIILVAGGGGGNAFTSTLLVSNRTSAPASGQNLSNIFSASNGIPMGYSTIVNSLLNYCNIPFTSSIIGYGGFGKETTTGECFGSGGGYGGGAFLQTNINAYAGGAGGGSFTTGGIIFTGNLSTPGNYLNPRYRNSFGIGSTATRAYNGGAVFSFFSTTTLLDLQSNGPDQYYSSIAFTNVIPPAFTSYITTSIWGAGGASRLASRYGGGGACVTQSFNYNSSDSLVVFIGQGGIMTQSTVVGNGTFGGGGASALFYNTNCTLIAGGGGCASFSGNGGGGGQSTNTATFFAFPGSNGIGGLTTAINRGNNNGSNSMVRFPSMQLSSQVQNIGITYNAPLYSLYSNGIPVATGLYPNPSSIVSSGGAFQIGSGLIGDVGQVLIYRRAADPREMLSSFRSTRYTYGV